MKITPHNNNILLERIEPETGGIIRPETAVKGACTFRVLEISAHIPDDAYSYKVGDEVLASVNNSYPVHQVLRAAEHLVLVPYMMVEGVVIREEGDDTRPVELISAVPDIVT